MPFVDGRWHGDIKSGPGGSDPDNCWASTTFEDGTTFKLAKRKDGHWILQLSNPSWWLPASQRYDMVALVDFYPRIHLAAEAKSPTLLEIAQIEQTALLGQIENGHTIDLTSDDFNERV